MLVTHLGCGKESAPTSQSYRGPQSTKQPAETEHAGHGSVEDSELVIEEVIEAPTPASREALLEQVNDHLAAGRNAKVKTLLRELLVRDPEDYESVFRLANLEAAEGNISQAIELLAGIPEDHPEAGLPSLGVSADWCFQAERYDDAEKRYRQVLKIDPSINFAKRKLAYLYNRQGRRHDAVVLIRELCIAGDVTQDELHALVVEGDAIYDPPGSQPAPGTRPYWPIGKSGVSRYLFTEKRFQEAAEAVRPIVESGEASPAIIAFFGRAAVEAQDDEMVALWRSHIDKQAQAYPEHWAAVGAHLIREAQYRPAVRALAEALRLDPTDLKSIRRLFQGLRSINQVEEAEIWVEHYAFMNQILRQSNLIASSATPVDNAIQSLADDLGKVDRKLEAILWRSVAASRRPDGRQEMAQLNQQMQQTISSKAAFPSKDQAWLRMNLGEDDLPNLPAVNSAIVTSPLQFPEQPSAPRFVDATHAIGLDHTYRIATKPAQKGFTIYQSMGGGVAVLDFDRDGESDLYFAQGAADSDEFVAAKSDQLYRTTTKLGGKADTLGVIDVTDSAGLNEQDYTVGVTAGDWNQDGFVDLAVANIGTNRLLINQGDGTFRGETLDNVPQHERFCTSLAMADVSGDQIPDLVVLNYLRDPDITQLPEFNEQGDVVNAMQPKSFKPSRDQVYFNLGDGNWEIQDLGADQTNACTGLGVVVSEFNTTSPGNEIFVGNDVMRNQLWLQTEARGFTDIAALQGCAYGARGASTAAMGIAVGDLDRSGTVDLHVSNYIDEPVSLFMNRGDIFRDLNIRYELTDDSLPVVGFGSQTMDYNNNGWLDLLVTNGHVEDLESQGQPFRQPMQLFANLGDRYQLVDVAGDRYWTESHLGRALAKLDFDRDGQLDFVVTDMLGPSRLLVNKSPSDGHWARFGLIGTSSERDAIGAKVELYAGQQSWSAWVTSGDGYLCKNEATVHFGIGSETAIDRVAVTWPNGKTQEFKPPRVDASWILVEGETVSFQE